VKRRCFSLSRQLVQTVPDYRRAILLGRRGRTPDQPAILEGLEVATLIWRADEREVTEVPTVERWRRAYRAVGLNPTKTRPAVEAAIRRARRDGAASLGIPAIDAGTIVTLTAPAPVGVHVLDDVAGDLVLGFATGEESFTTLQGERDDPPAGELVWRAGNGVLTRRWVHKQGALGSVTEHSEHFAVNLDLLGDDDLDAGKELLESWLRVAGILVEEVLVLDRETPTAEATV
jgi:DNA/RNA-binding domain of Phe-tRNA-synthetase-like protein